MKPQPSKPTQGEEHMNVYWYCLLSKVVAVTGFVVLAMDDKPWIGLLCFIVLATIDGPLKDKKTWVGLTHQERNEIRGRYWLAMSDAVFDDIEAKLKAKNFTSSEGFKEKNT